MEKITIEANLREHTGSSASRRLRLAGRTPGIIYGANTDAVQIELHHNNLYHSLLKEGFRSSILDIKIGEKIEKALLRDYQMHPYKKIVMHIDFQRIDQNAPITMKVPVHYSGEEISPAVKTGGALITHVQNQIEIRCLPKDLPQYIDVDLSKLELGQSVHAKDVVLPANVNLSISAEHENTVLVIMSTAE
jgi:large subunit ribosomal protein L25